MNNKTFKTIAISLIVFTLVAVGVTYGMIRFTIENKTKQLIASGDTEVIEKIPEEDDEQYINLGIDPNGTYNENSIEWIEQAYQENETKIKYYKISGLKDKTVENKINERLKNSVFKYFDQSKVDTVKINAYQSINASFGNVICVFSSVSIGTVGSYSNYTYESEYINLNLVTGEDIEFKDLFVDENAMLQMIAAELHENEAWSKQWDKETDMWDGGYEYDEDLWNAPILDVNEDNIFQKLNLWKKAKDIEFSFSSNYINATATYGSGEKLWTYISYKSLPSAIGIYNKYLTEKSIYENDSIGLKNIINMSSQDPWLYTEYKEYKNDKESNLFATARVANNTEEIDYEISQEIEELVVNMAKNQMIEIDRKAMAEPDKYHAFTLYYYTYKAVTGEAFYIHEDKRYYFTDIENKDEMYNKILDSYVYSGGEDYGVYDLYIDLEYTEENKFISGDTSYDTHLYSLKTFEKLENVEDFFMDGVDYKTLMKNEFNKLWYRTYGEYLDEEQLEEEYNNTEFEYDTDWVNRQNKNCFEVYNKWLGFKSYSDDYRETGYKIYFDAFNPEDLTI